MSIRHEFYETDDRVTITIFVRGADPEKVKVDLTPTSVEFQHGESSLSLNPLKGEIDPAASTFTVSKVKVEVRLQKKAEGRWGMLVKTTDDDDDKPGPPTDVRPANEPLFESRKKQKNWDKVTTDILSQEKDKTTNEDPNAGGDAALNGFFQQLYSGADEDSKRAMMKSFVESGGTTLSTNWDEVGKAHVDVKPPEGSEWKKWGA